MFDLEPAAAVMVDLVRAVRDDQLEAPTPCRDTTVATMLNHIDGFSMAFTAAATKTPLDARPPADASRLGHDWRSRIPTRLAGLAAAWHDENAWEGMTQAGGVELPAEAAAQFALDELIVHGWDLAVAIGQPFSVDPALLDTTYAFVEQWVAQNPNGTAGLFGPPVAVADDAPQLDRLIGLTGRDPVGTPRLSR
jgi:uncharacterized protein (TIGR03086 family)